ncbi:phage minor head protein [Fundidesulfovibrio butyratiphilus]
MPKPVNLSFAMGLPPKDAVAYFESKGHRVTFDWREMDQRAHAQAFTVAKMVQVDMLKDVQACLQRCLKEGKTEAWFVKQMEPELRAKGWWGKKPMIDPRTGEERTVGLGSPARLKLIYRQNMQTAYMAGRYKQMLENAENRPWWQYVAILDGKTRPSHKVLAGRVFRFDDPFWASHSPPNGFNCRCRVRALSDFRLEEDRKDATRKAEERRKAGKAPDPQAPSLEPESGVGNMVTREVIGRDRATGQKIRRTVTGYRVPETGYTAFTDVGFSANAGASWIGGQLGELVRKLETAPPEIARQAVRDMARGPALEEWLKRPAGDFPLVVLPEADAARIGATAQVGRLSPATAGKQAKNHPDLSAVDYAKAQEAVDSGDLLQDGAKSLLYVLDEPGGLVVVVKATLEGDELYVQSLRHLSRDEAEKDRVVRRLKKRNAPR